VAKADRQPAPKRVSLKAVSDVLQERAGESLLGIKRFVLRLIAEVRYRHRGPEDPPSDFCRGDIGSFTLDGSDVINALCVSARGAYRLPGVSFDWADVAAEYPELGTEPPEPGRSHVEVSFSTSLMRRLEVLVEWLAKLWRAPAPRKWVRGEELEWLGEWIDRDPPPSEWGEKKAWGRRVLHQMRIDFDGKQTWHDEDTVRKKAGDILRDRASRTQKK
jgi:hypothetical protein